ncbi:hypothetical protein APHAL10511_007691 [Amanita phalloides]|nr:hypothetical protein APHAL10511_007691 [Amanita phalloides]
MVSTAAKTLKPYRQHDPPLQYEANYLEVGQVIMNYSSTLNKDGNPIPYLPVIFLGYFLLKDGSNSNTLRVATIQEPRFTAHSGWKDFSHYFPDDAGKTRVTYRGKEFLLGGKISLAIQETTRRYIRMPDSPVMLDTERTKMLRKDMVYHQNLRTWRFLVANVHHNEEDRNQEVSAANANTYDTPVEVEAHTQSLKGLRSNSISDPSRPADPRVPRPRRGSAPNTPSHTLISKRFVR